MRCDLCRNFVSITTCTVCVHCTHTVQYTHMCSACVCVCVQSYAAKWKPQVNHTLCCTDGWEDLYGDLHLKHTTIHVSYRYYRTAYTPTCARHSNSHKSRSCRVLNHLHYTRCCIQDNLSVPCFHTLVSSLP